MTLITFQDGKPVMRDGKIGTEQDCCCGGGCSSAGLEQFGQPTVSVTDGGCPCNAGTHSGTYDFSYHFNGVWSWDGTTTCEYVDGAPVLANIGVSVTCDAATGNWIVTVFTYQFDSLFISGTLSTRSLTVNNGNLEGSVEVEMYGAGVLQCTFTVTFG